MGRRWGGSRYVIAGLAAVLLVLCLTSCGGDQDASGSSAADERPAAGRQETESVAGTDKTTTTTTGKGPHGAEVFLNENGSSKVTEFGVEASAAERQAAAEAVGGYIEGGAAERWSQQCRYLSRSILEPLEVAAAEAGQGEDSCAEILEAIAERTPASRRVDNMASAVGSLRVQGNRGYALYRGTDGSDYVIPVSREDGQWKVAAQTPLLIS